MANVAPGDLIVGYKFNQQTQTLEIPLASLPGLTAQAAAANGDGREVVWALINAIAQAYTNLPSDKRPGRANVRIPTPIGIPGGLRLTFTFSFDRSVDTTQTEMLPE